MSDLVMDNDRCTDNQVKTFAYNIKYMNYDYNFVIPECSYRESNDFNTTRSPIRAFGDDK